MYREVRHESVVEIKADVALIFTVFGFWPKSMVQPCVARRFRQVGGERSCINVSDLWLEHHAPGHHGYQRAYELITGKASTDHLGHQCSHAPGRPNLRVVSSSRRPRRV